MKLRIRSEYLKQIAEGLKTVEGRLAKPELAHLKPGDLLEFVSETSQIESYVTYTKHFNSFKEFLLDQGIQHCLPGLTDLEKGLEIYRSFPGYLEGEEKWGVLAIGIRRK
jgi:ASC-1-like (ASCH) protein